MIYAASAEMLTIYLVFSTLVWLWGAFVVFVLRKAPLYHFASIFVIYHFIGFIYRPLVLLVTGASVVWEWIGVFPKDLDIARGVIVFNFSYIVFILGFLFANKRRAPIRLFEKYDFEARRFGIFLIISALALIVGFYALSITVGDLSYKISGDNYSRGYVDSKGGYVAETSGYVSLFADMLGVTIVMLCVMKKTRKVGIALAIGYISYRLLIGAARSSFISVLLSFMVIAFAAFKMRMPRFRFIVAGIFIILLFDVIGSSRTAFLDIAVGKATVSEVFQKYSESRSEGAGTSDFSEFDVATSLLSVVPEKTDWTYGSQYLRLIVWPIPRFIWEDKPIFTSIINFLDYGNFYALTFTLYMDSYMTGGLVMMMFIIFGISTALSRAYVFVSRNQTPRNLLIYTACFSFCPILFRDGPVSYLYFCLINSTFIVLVCKLAKLIRKQDRIGVPRNA